MLADDTSDPGYLYTLLDEAVGPYQVPGLPYVVAVPTGQEVARLDWASTPVEILGALVDPDDLDDLLDDLDAQPYSVTVRLADDVLAHFGLTVPPDEGYGRLADELDRYGPGIEFDLQGRGVNLYDFVTDPGRWPWSKMMRWLPFLPTGGGYKTAVVTDMKLAKDLADAEEKGELPPTDNRPPPLGWTPELEALTAISDTLERIEHAEYATSPKHKKVYKPPPKPSKRPKFAKERDANLRLLREHDEIASKVLGNRYERKGW